VPTCEWPSPCYYGRRIGQSGDHEDRQNLNRTSLHRKDGHPVLGAVPSVGLAIFDGQRASEVILSPPTLRALKGA
jgi:hypothetical protein